MTADNPNLPNVLLIADHHRSRLAYAAGLGGYGYDVTEADSIQHAAVLLENGYVPETIVIDLRLETQEIDLMTEFISWTVPHTGVVVIGHDNEEMAAQRGGADDFLHRPVNVENLLNTLHTAVRQ